MLYPTLGIIEEKKCQVIDKCKTKMLAAWLQQQDNVTNKGVPVLDGVAYIALRNIGENELTSQGIT